MECTVVGYNPFCKKYYILEIKGLKFTKTFPNTESLKKILFTPEMFPLMEVKVNGLTELDFEIIDGKLVSLI